METQVPDLGAIENFLAQKRIAMVGVSREPRSFSVSLFQELCRRGYDIVPVNPKTPNVLGRPCFARVQDIQPPVDAALVMTPPEITEKIVADCAQAGIRRVWLHRATGKGSVSPRAVEFCRAHAIEVIPGQCPFMFLPNAGGVHRFHAFIRKITGRYPRRAPA
jgi:uncharacterized protein